jgi:transcriptional regulator with XRE-family HTH domain
MDRNLIGYRFKSLRIKKGFDTQIDLIRDFKEKTGIEIKKSALSMYESGQRLPEHELLGIFADYFNVTTDYLYGRSDVELDVVKSTMRNLDLLFDKLSDNDKSEAIRYMEYLNFARKDDNHEKPENEEGRKV